MIQRRKAFREGRIVADSILVRGRASSIAAHVGRGLALLMALASGGLILGGLGSWSMVGLAAALGVYLVSEVLARRSAARRLWVTDVGDGFILRDGWGEQRCDDSEVREISLDVREKYRNGLLKSSQRRTVLWIDGQPRPVEMISICLAGRDDPLAPLVQRIVNGLCDRYRLQIEQGGLLVGDGWSLDRQSLRIDARPLPVTVELADVVSVGHFNRRICVWKRGESLPSAKFPPDGRNVPVLRDLIVEHVEVNRARPCEAGPDGRASEAGAGPEPSDADFGRTLFERHSGIMPWVLVVGVAILGVAGIALLPFPGTGPAGMVLLVFAAVGVIAVVLAPPSRLVCCERGLRSWSLTGWRELPYERVEEFCYEAVRHFVDGAYSGTQFALRFRSHTTKIAFHVRLKHRDEDIETLRDHVARVLAGRMARRLNAGKAVRWTPRLALQPDGIIYRPQGLVRSGAPTLLPYEQVQEFHVSGGRFFVVARGAKRPVIDEPVSAPNFFPGFYLLTTLCNPAREDYPATP